MIDVQSLAANARDVGEQTVRRLREHDVLIYAGSLAFHGLLALFPFLLFLLAAISFLGLPELFEQILGWARRTLPEPGYEQVAETVEHLRVQREGLISVGALGAVWAASGGIRAAMTILNRAYGVQTPRSTFRRFLASAGFTIGLAALLITTGVLLAVGPRLLAQIAGLVGLADVVVTVWQWLRLPAAVALLVVVSAMFYSLLPNVKGVRFITPGSLIAVPMWLVATWGFSIYTRNFANQNVLYGSIGAVILLMLFFWVSAIILLVGAEVNGVVHRRSIKPNPGSASAR